MDDKFLYEGKPILNAQFADTLYDKISDEDKRKSSLLLIKPFLWVRRVSLAFVILSILILLAITFKSDIQAFASNLIQGLQPESYLIGNMIVIDIPPGSTTFPIETPSANRTSIPAIYIPIDEIRERTGLEIDLPYWAPAGCVLEPDVFAWDDDEIPSVTITWSCNTNKAGDGIFLSITDAPMIASLPTGSYNVVEVNNKPVLIIHGIWSSQAGSNGDTTWAMINDFERLTWDDGDYLYQLWSTSNHVSEEDLLRMVSTVYK